MLHAFLDAELNCPVHPDYNPMIEAPAKRCKTCAAMNTVNEWIKLASNKATKIREGFYGGVQAEEAPLPTAAEIADIAGPVEAKPKSLRRQ